MRFNYHSKIKSFLLNGVKMLFLSAFLAAAVFSQADNTPPKKLVRWNMLGGTDKEIFIAVPDNSIVDDSKDFYLGSNGLARVDSLRTLISSLNQTVLQIDFYEGKAEEIEKQLLKRFRNDALPDTDKDSKNVGNLEIKEQRIGDFFWRDLKYKTPDCSWKIQFFRIKTRLYVLKAVSRDAGDLILRSFFEAVRVVSKDTSISPNLNGKTEQLSEAKLSLPPLVLLKSNVSGETEKIYEAKELDKPPVVVRVRAGNLELDKNYFYNSYNVIKLKVLLKADGTVGEVETITKVSKALEERTLKNAKDTKFIPAEKNGKPVSTYVTLQYSLTIG